MAVAVLVSIALTGCRTEPPPGEVVAYQYTDPAVTELATWRIYPGSNLLPEQRDLIVSARRLLASEADAGKLLVLDTDVPLAIVADYYAAEYGIEIVSGYVPNESGDPAPQAYMGEGDFATDEEALAPMLDELGVEFARGVVAGAYKTALIRVEHGPTISLQRPYRDFIADRVVDRTLIMIAE